MMLSAAPLASITVTRTNPGPSGAKNKVRRPCAFTGTPLTRTVSGATPPATLSASQGFATSDQTLRYGETYTLVADHIVDEATDIRQSVPACTINDGYANGYGISKWAGEVLMRRVHDLCALPVTVFRPGMILADSRYAGQLNAPDIFTRLLFSLVATGIAPRSFYQGGGRPHYEGLPVDFLAAAIATVPHQDGAFATFNTTNPHDDGV